MRRWLQRRGTRVGRWYVGTCTAGPHITILRSGRGTYCAWHRLVRYAPRNRAPEDGADR